LSILPIYVLFIAASFIVSLNVYKQKVSEFYLKLFPPFLFTSLLVEIFALYLVSLGKENYYIYSVFTAIEFVFYMYVLSCLISNNKMRRFIRYILIFNAVIALVNLLFIQKGRFNSITYSLSCLLIVFFSIYYFLELFRYPKAVKLINQPAFWICSGLLFYYCCSFPLLGLTNFLGEFPAVLLNNVYIFLNVMNILLYTLFIIAFLCRIKMPRYISQ
jgi:hypothetical protein